MTDKTECTLADGFRLGEKIWAQGSFFGMGIFAIVGISLVDWRWVFPYLVIYAYGIMGVVMRHLVCPRCPHLFVYNDCLQLPVPITRWLVKEQKTTPFSALERLLFYTIFLLIPTFPIYWLVSNPLLLVGLLLSAAMWYGGQFFHFCKRCRVEHCPFNRVAFTY
mgnify:CR=1 FL=1